MAIALSAAVAAVAVPAVSAAPAVKAKVEHGTLRISGTPQADRIVLRLSAADPNQLQVDVGDDGSADFTVGLNTFGAIDVNARGGDDTVRIDQVNGAFTTTKATRLSGNGGNDTLIGANGAEVFFGDKGNDVVDGNGGADTAFLGKGDDTFVWDPGDGSDDVDGGEGSDTMVFNGNGGNEIMAAAANGSHAIFTRNLGSIVMDLDHVETIDVNALGGNDAITVNDMTGTDLSRVDIDLAATGGSADGLADTVTVNGTNGVDTIAAYANGAAVEVSGLATFVRITHADPADDKLSIDSLGGVDTVTVDPAVAPLIGVSVL